MTSRKAYLWWPWPQINHDATTVQRPCLMKKKTTTHAILKTEQHLFQEDKTKYEDKKEQGQVGQRCVLFEWTFFMNECFLWMNVFYEWMSFMHGLELFFCWKMHDFDVFKTNVTNQPIIHPTNQPTNGHSLSKRCKDTSNKVWHLQCWMNALLTNQPTNQLTY